MINALWQSKPVTGRSRGFVTHLEGPVFGWEAVEDMWKRDKDRRAKNVSREVPSLQESFIKRDAWTKLNVRPAKVMQVNNLVNTINAKGTAIHQIKLYMFAKLKTSYSFNCNVSLPS